jgi:uncharacterized RDD family membrane protein YckC
MITSRSLRAPGFGWLTATLITLAIGAGVSAETPDRPAPPSPPQAPEAPPPPPAPDVPSDTTPDGMPPEWRRSMRLGQPTVRIGQDIVVRAGETVHEVVVVSGSATIEGYVQSDVVVVLGAVTLGPTAVIDGDLVVVAGGITVAPGAKVGRDFVIVGGDVNIPSDFSPGGEHVVIAPGFLGYDLSGVVPWVTRGLMWGRPLVPELPWMWALVGAFLFVYLLVSLLLSGPVQAGVATLIRRPFTAFLTGLLVLLLIGPVSVILSVSIIGIPVVPFLFCALLVAGLIGKVSVMHWIGDRVAPPEPGSRLHWTRSFLIGFAVLTVAYMIPVLGFTTWALFGVLGLGAASLAFVAAWRRENPEAPRRVPAPPVPPVPPQPPSPVPPAVAFARDDQSPPVLSQADVAGRVADMPPITGGPSVGPPAPPVGTVDLRSFPYARFLERAAAFALDVILVVIVFRVLGIRGPDDEGRFFLLLLAYHIGFWTWKGTTVGGIICQLRLVRTDGGRLQFVDALVRGLTSILSLVALGLGALWILKDPERQSWHDKIAGTYVVKVPRHWPLE